METTIRLSNAIKEKLDSMKVHSRESYNDVIARVIGNMKKDIDEESLRETIDVLSDSETMRDIAEALDDYERGRFVELK
jgi:predicted CopG family antitoxin